MFFISAIGRLIKRGIWNNFNGINVLYYAISDVYSGFEEITKIGADKKLANIRKSVNNKSSLKQIFKILYIVFRIIFNYKKYKNKYVDFRNYTVNASFWKSYYEK